MADGHGLGDRVHARQDAGVDGDLVTFSRDANPIVGASDHDRAHRTHGGHVVALGLAALQKDHKPFVVLDANGKETRQSQGFIPTALLLTSASEYDLALLPKEKSTPLVFYCANDKCTASHTAAKRALQSGYSDVGVLGAGISGWVKAGKPVQKQPVG